MPLIFLLLKKCEMISSICDVFFQHVEIQNLVIRESSGADISFSGGAAARAARGCCQVPPPHPAPSPGAGTAAPHRGSSPRAPGQQAGSRRRAPGGAGNAQNPCPKCTAYSAVQASVSPSVRWSDDLSTVRPGAGAPVSHPRVAARMKLVNAGSVPRWAPATQSARRLCLTRSLSVLLQVSLP